MADVDDIRRHYERLIEQERRDYERMAEQARADRERMSREESRSRLELLVSSVTAMVVGYALSRWW